MNTRIRMIRKKKNLSRAEFGRILGVSGDVINNLERGRVKHTEHMIKLICSEFNVDYDWLKFGIGEMFQENDNSTMAAIDAILTGEDEFAKKLFKEFANLSQEEWELLKKLIDKLALIRKAE